MAKREKKRERGSQRLTRQEMRNSFLLPIALGLTILLVGVVIAMLAPWSFDISISVFIGLLLLAYLIWSTRKAPWRLRLLAILFAVPALVGITLGLINGRATDTLIGVGITLIALALLRFFQTPLSFRAAYRRFRAGDREEALRLINKSLSSRPDYWESYQLRALIHLADMNLRHAEQDARQAAALRPEAHPAYNTLGHVYLAQEDFAAAEEAYASALDQAPGYALYNYHLGLSEFRQGKFDEAAQSFAAATQGTLPLIEYDLQSYYYLGRSLDALGETEHARAAWEQMVHFRDGLEPLKRQLSAQPPYPHLPRMQDDLQDIEQRLADGQAAEPEQD